MSSFPAVEPFRAIFIRHGGPIPQHTLHWQSSVQKNGTPKSIAECHPLSSFRLVMRSRCCNLRRACVRPLTAHPDIGALASRLAALRSEASKRPPEPTTSRPRRPTMEVNRDHDPLETTEWLEALKSVVAVRGPERANFLLGKLLEEARRDG